MAEQKELAPAQSNLPAKSMGEMPEFQPMDNQDTIRLPRLIMIQDKSPLVEEGLGKPGDLINSLSKENYGASVEVIPLIQTKNTRIRWQPRGLGGGIMCISRDGKNGNGNPGGECASCVFYANRRGKDQNDDQWCSSNYQVIGLVRASREPIMLAADSIRPSEMGIRDMLGMARIAASKGIRLFGKSYVLRTALTKNNLGSFFKLQCVPGNNNAPLPDEELTYLEEQMTFFRGQKVDVPEGVETPY